MVRLKIKGIKKNKFTHSLGLHQISKPEMPTDNHLTRCSQYITIPRSNLAGFLGIETSVVIDIKKNSLEGMCRSTTC